MKNVFCENETNIFDNDSFNHDLYNDNLTWIHSQTEWKFKRQIFCHTKQMFVHSDWHFQNNIDLNIENENNDFVIQRSFQQITDEDQNAFEKFESFTANKNRLW